MIDDFEDEVSFIDEETRVMEEGERELFDALVEEAQLVATRRKGLLPKENKNNAEQAAKPRRRLSTSVALHTTYITANQSTATGMNTAISSGASNPTAMTTAMAGAMATAAGISASAVQSGGFSGAAATAPVVATLEKLGIRAKFLLLLFFCNRFW